MNNPNFVWKRWMIIPFLLPWKMNRNLPNNHYYKIFGVEELVDLPFQVAFVFVILPWPMDVLPSLLRWNQSRKVFRRFYYWLIYKPAKFSWLVLLMSHRQRLMPCCGTKRVRVNHEALISRKLLPWVLCDRCYIFYHSQFRWIFMVFERRNFLRLKISEIDYNFSYSISKRPIDAASIFQTN